MKTIFNWILSFIKDKISITPTAIIMICLIGYNIYLNYKYNKLNDKITTLNLDTAEYIKNTVDSLIINADKNNIVIENNKVLISELDKLIKQTTDSTMTLNEALLILNKAGK